MTCGNCTSADIRKLSLVYESGLTFVGVSSGGKTIRGQNMTAVSLKAAPPARRGLVGWFLLFFLSAIFIQFSLWWILGAVVGLGKFVEHLMWNTRTYPILYRQWDAAYMCERCGAMGEPTPTTGDVRTIDVTPLEPPKQALP